MNCLAQSKYSINNHVCGYYCYMGILRVRTTSFSRKVPIFSRRPFKQGHTSSSSLTFQCQLNKGEHLLFSKTLNDWSLGTFLSASGYCSNSYCQSLIASNINQRQKSDLIKIFVLFVLFWFSPSEKWDLQVVVYFP